MLTEFESQVLAEVSLDIPWKLIESFATVIREHPDKVNHAADLLADKLASFGVPVEVYEPNIYLSLPIAASVEYGAKSLPAKAPSYSISVPEGISGELVYVPASYASATEDVFTKADRSNLNQESVKGKIVLTEGYANPANVLLFQELGALGVIAINPGEDIHWGTCTSIWGTPDIRSLERKPSIPAVAINNPDGQLLKQASGNHETVTIKTTLEEGWYKSKIPVVTIPGTEEPEKFVLLHGHYDSWDIGIGDNTTGDATMLEIARILWKNKSHLKRSVRIAWWPGHSTGRYAGSTWYADKYAIDLEENCVAQVNCDSPGCRWATEYEHISWTVETADFAGGVISDVTGQQAFGERAHQAGDYSFNNIGISGYFMLLSTMPEALVKQKGYYAVGGCGGNIAWHTENDQLEIADREILEKDIKIYLLAVLRNVTAEIIPFDWCKTTKEFKATLQRYQAAAGEKFDFAEALREVDALDEALQAFYSATERHSLSAQAANQAIKDLARLLIPINFTREQRFFHDPALSIPQLPDLALATNLREMSSDRLGFAQVELIRGQNRLISTLRQAQRLVRAALA